jgi:polar amino acid transport system substrate-binding protein
MRIICALTAISALLCGAALAGEGKVYIIGTNAEFPPFEYIDDSGNFAGFDMELIGMILERIGVAYEYETMGFNALLPALATDRIDIAVAAITIRDDRRENALFSEPYFHATQKIIVSAGNADIAGEADLSGKAIGVQLGTTGDIYITSLADWGDLTDVNIQRFDKAIDAVIDLTTGRLDAVVVDEGVSVFFSEAFKGLSVLEETLSDEQYGMAMKLGSDEFMALINEQLAAMIEDGAYDELFGKYFASAVSE